MDVPRVLVVDNGRLLGAGIESLLGVEIDLEVIGVSSDSRAGLIEEIRRFQPGVIVLDKDTYLTDPTSLLISLEDYSEVRVVQVSANSDLVCIYDKEQVLLTQGADLIKIIRDGKTYRPRERRARDSLI
jgi:DNA-binding NarL/FixJ family response regulator